MRRTAVLVLSALTVVLGVVAVVRGDYTMIKSEAEDDINYLKETIGDTQYHLIWTDDHELGVIVTRLTSDPRFLVTQGTRNGNNYVDIDTQGAAKEACECLDDYDIDIPSKSCMPETGKACVECYTIPGSSSQNYTITQGGGC